MSWKFVFTGFEGRIGRRDFWKSVTLLAVAQFVVFWIVLIGYFQILVQMFPRYAGHVPTMETIAAILPAVAIWYLIGLWPTLAIFTKRWHDRNKSGWWNLVTPALLIPILILIIVAASLVLGPAVEGVQDNPSIAPAVIFHVVWWGAIAWTIVELGCLRGTEGPNEFGPDPLTGQVSGESARSGPVLGRSIPYKKPRIAYLFTSFEGRINRAKWWLGAVILLFISVGIMFTLVRLMGIRTLWELDSTGVGPAEMMAVSRSFAVVQAIMLVIIAYPATALMKKRINDRDRPGWLVFVFWAPTIVGLVLSLAGLEHTFVDEGGVLMSAESRLYWIVSIPGLIVSIWALIELGFLRGTEGANQYGDDPLA